MPLLRNLSRRFNLLTTDATPDPPRIPPEGYTHNLEPNTNGEAKNDRPQEEQIILTSERKKSFENEAVPIEESKSNTSTKEDFNDAKPANDTRGQKRPNVKTKSKQNCTCRTRTVNYNIINSSDVNIGSKTSYICNVNQLAKNDAKNPSEETWSKTKFRRMPMEVEHLSVSTDRVTIDDIFVVKTYMGHGWRDVARKLSYLDGQIEQFEENYRFKGISEVIYQIFLDWLQANTKHAEIGKLINILWECKEYDCAEQLVSARTKSI